ncbi:MAG: hypothetical protein ACKOPS_12155, partial [Cyanobium sp.]
MTSPPVPAPADPLAVLRQVFGYGAFRGPQAAIVRHVIGGGSGLVLMPTGGGKSLCYQVPPMVLGSLALAVLVNRKLPGIHWFRGAFYTPVLVSIVVAAIAFRWLYAENGLVNGWL